MDEWADKVAKSIFTKWARNGETELKPRSNNANANDVVHMLHELNRQKFHVAQRACCEHGGGSSASGLLPWFCFLVPHPSRCASWRQTKLATGGKRVKFSLSADARCSIDGHKQGLSALARWLTAVWRLTETGNGGAHHTHTHAHTHNQMHS